MYIVASSSVLLYCVVSLCPAEKAERLERAEKTEKPIKLVLKVGGSQEKVASKNPQNTPNRSASSLERIKSKDHSSKKKKKKRSSSKERKKPKLEASIVGIVSKETGAASVGN